MMKRRRGPDSDCAVFHLYSRSGLVFNLSCVSYRHDELKPLNALHSDYSHGF